MAEERMSLEEYNRLIGKSTPAPSKKPSKYRNVKTEYNGRTYDSKKEARYAQGLDAALKAGQIKAWTPQVSWPITHNSVNRYRFDFVIKNNDNTYRFIDVKGRDTPMSKMKRGLMKSEHDIDVELA